MASIGNIANGEIFKLSIGLLILSSIIMMLVTKVRKVFTKNKKKAILYALFILATFAATALLSSSKILNDTPINSFYGFQVLFLLLGILHLWFVRKYFPALNDDPSDFFTEFLFAFAYCALGLIAFTNVVNRFKSPFSYVFIGSVLWFIIPTLVYKLYEFATQIPLPVFDSWYFPIGKDIKDPTKDELANPKVISFEFKKKDSLSDVTNFRIKAPQSMEFGKLFYFFLIDYNERHPEGQIDIVDTNTQQPSGWVFHVKPKWYQGIKHINFNHTVAASAINEDDVIICRRVTS
ncbi:MAG: TssN family type VI secretion system protein [Patiriisocius sp.]|uniref:TssN family type VI secretion system protein n=1 Tax=Patiriisocius sp. TaxID=2822396 RepID=UPI003EF916DA